jgi:acyl-CoA thioesterase-2
MKTIGELLRILTLEKIDENIYRAQNYKTPWKRIFGGQVLAQSIQAAFQTIPLDRELHSMHAYFLRAGDIEVPVIYDVDRIRDGGSFNTRRVVAIQKGRAIFNMAASFHVDTQNPLQHQLKMPDVPKPSELKSSDNILFDLQHRNPELFKKLYVPKPIEFRPVENYDPEENIDQEPIRHVWFRAKDRLPDNPRLHQVVLAYISDYYLMTTASLPNRSVMLPDDYFFASLDHGMWFHRNFRADEWLLYQLDSPSSGNSRGLSRGMIFSIDGTLVASTIQEGLMAPIRES